MNATGRSLEETVWATADVLLSAVGLTIVFYPAVSLGNALLGAPFDATRVGSVVGIFAFGGAYPFVAGERSLGRLGDFVFVFTAAALAFGLAGTAIVALSGVEIVTGSSAARTSVVALACAVAWLVVYGRG